MGPSDIFNKPLMGDMVRGMSEFAINAFNQLHDKQESSSCNKELSELMLMAFDASYPNVLPKDDGTPDTLSLIHI